MSYQRPINGWMAERHIGERMRRARRAARISVSSIERAGICSRDTIYNIENNERMLSTENLVTLCKLYGVPLTYILKEAL